MKSSSATWKRSVCLTVACLTQLTVLVYAEKVATNEDLEAFLKRKGGSVAKSNGKVANTDQGVPLQLDIKPAPIVESVSEVRCELGSAVLSGDLSKVQAMLDKGCDPNVRDEITGGNTPLCYAAFKGSDEIIRLLVSKGAEINTTDESAISALLLAVMGKHLSSVKLLLDAGANPDFVGGAPDGSTPLINATLGDGDIRIMQLLLEHNANPNLTNRINAFTALDIAIAKKRKDKVDLLKAYGAKTNKLNRNSDLVSDNQSSTQESAAPQPSVDGGVVTQIKSRIAAEHPGDYYLQKILVDAEIKSWQELQHNYTDIPDSVFNEIRDRKAQEHPNQYHLQQILTDADVKAWKELKQ